MKTKSPTGTTNDRTLSSLKELGLSAEDIWDERTIRKAYLRQSMKRHPDKGGSNADFQQLSDAYQRLLNSNNNSSNKSVKEECSSYAASQQQESSNKSLKKTCARACDMPKNQDACMSENQEASSSNIEQARLLEDEQIKIELATQNKKKRRETPRTPKKMPVSTPRHAMETRSQKKARALKKTPISTPRHGMETRPQNKARTPKKKPVSTPRRAMETRSKSSHPMVTRSRKKKQQNMNEN